MTLTFFIQMFIKPLACKYLGNGDFDMGLGRNTYNKLSNEPPRSISRLGRYDSFIRSKCDSSAKRASYRSSTMHRPSGMIYIKIRPIYGTYVPCIKHCH
jgi:hypothetical protein